MADARKLTNLRLVLIRHGRVDGGKVRKPMWDCLFDLDDKARRLSIPCNGELRPLGSDILGAMQTFIVEGLVTEQELLDIKIIE